MELCEGKTLEDEIKNVLLLNNIQHLYANRDLAWKLFYQVLK